MIYNFFLNFLKWLNLSTCCLNDLVQKITSNLSGLGRVAYLRLHICLIDHTFEYPSFHFMTGNFAVLQARCAQPEAQEVTVACSCVVTGLN